MHPGTSVQSCYLKLYCVKLTFQVLKLGFWADPKVKAEGGFGIIHMSIMASLGRNLLMRGFKLQQRIFHNLQPLISPCHTWCWCYESRDCSSKNASSWRATEPKRRDRNYIENEKLRQQTFLTKGTKNITAKRPNMLPQPQKVMPTPHFWLISAGTF